MTDVVFDYLLVTNQNVYVVHIVNLHKQQEGIKGQGESCITDVRGLSSLFQQYQPITCCPNLLATKVRYFLELSLISSVIVLLLKICESSIIYFFSCLLVCQPLFLLIFQTLMYCCHSCCRVFLYKGFLSDKECDYLISVVRCVSV